MILFVCTQLNGFKPYKWLNSSIWPIDNRYYHWVRVDLIVIAMKKYFTFPRTGASSSTGLVSYPGNFSVLGFTPSVEMQLVYGCPEYDTKMNLMGRLVLESVEYPSISIPPSLLWPSVVVPIRILSIDQIDLFNNYSCFIGLFGKLLRHS